MKKETIETLINLCNFQIDAFKKEIEIVRLKLKHAGNINMPQVEYYRKSLNTIVDSHEIEIAKLNSCLSDLQKLKEFDLPSDSELKKIATNPPSLGWDQWVRGAIYMRDLIKSKLS